MLLRGRARLAAAGVETAALDARLLLAAATGLDMAALMASGPEPLPPREAQAFADHIARRAGGEPVARILGRQEFRGLPFGVNTATLIPRPETEILVEAALAEAGNHPADLSVCDLGTGSGAILIALLSALPRARGLGIDMAPDALAQADANAARFGVADRATFQCADFAAAEGTFHIVVSNPPYVRSGDIQGLPREVRDHDPLLALDGGPDGLAAYRVIARRAPVLLLDGGALILEVGAGQADDVAGLCRAAGLDTIAVRPDLAGIDRVVVAKASRQAAKIPLGNGGIKS